MPLLLKILIATVVSGLFSLAGGIALLGRAKWINQFSVHFVSFAVGVLLATSFLDLLPEGVEFAAEGAEKVFLSALVGIIAFFTLERLILKFHPHHHVDEDASHHHPVPLLLSIGDTFHNFIDGILVAVSFLANPALGVVTAFSVAAHEIPQEISDFSVMLNHGWGRRKVLWANIFSSLASVAGGVLAYLFRDAIYPVLPQLLGATAGIFLYIATADLIPEISSKEHWDKTSHVLGLVILGAVSVGLLIYFLE